MSKFGDSEAEEDSLDESLSEKSDDDEDEDEEGEEEEEQAEDENDIINDEVEESAGEEEEGHHGHHHRKRRKADEAEELDEEDLSLIEENLGISIKRKKPRLKKIKVLDSDEEEEDQLAGSAAVKEREAIANQLFEGGDDSGEVAAEPAQAPGDDTYADIDESESEEAIYPHGRLPTPVDYNMRRKKSTDFPHWWRTCTLTPRKLLQKGLRIHNVSFLTECEFVTTFCGRDCSVPC